MTALELVSAERDRQERLRDTGMLQFTAATPACPDVLRVSALGEEYGEVCRALQEGDTHGLLTELVHTAAVAVAWIEYLSPDKEKESSEQ